MKIFNTLTRQKEEFVPLEEGKVKMYVCGPTVYNLIHIGNARPMIIFDTVRRYLEYKGYEVNYVSNFTDVDDKIIKKAIEEGVSAEEISQRYIEECKKDMAGMNVKPATTHPQATQEIDGMISMIQTLMDKGYAYAVADGTVYFRVKKFKEYGKLSHKNLATFLQKYGFWRLCAQLFFCFCAAVDIVDLISEKMLGQQEIFDRILTRDMEKLLKIFRIIFHFQPQMNLDILLIFFLQIQNRIHIAFQLV